VVKTGGSVKSIEVIINTGVIASIQTIADIEAKNMAS